jgi:hypothetical protein
MAEAGRDYFFKVYPAWTLAGWDIDPLDETDGRPLVKEYTLSGDSRFEREPTVTNVLVMVFALRQDVGEMDARRPFATIITVGIALLAFSCCVTTLREVRSQTPVHSSPADPLRGCAQRR